ncbi:glycosyl transferase family 1 [Caballeronia temeraria]
MKPSDAWPQPHHSALLDRFASRVAAAIASLLGNTDFTLTDAQFDRLSAIRELIQDILGAAPLRNADHVAKKFLPSIDEEGNVRLPFPDAVRRLSVLCNSESRLALDFSACLRADPLPTLHLALATASELLPGSAHAHQKREAMLDWLSKRFDEIDNVRDIEMVPLVALYMFCTYAEIEHRHAIKRSINRLVRNTFSEVGFPDLVRRGESPQIRRVRPLMLVVLEAFRDGHSILRTHSLNLAAARAHFDIVAFCDFSAIGKLGREVFTQVLEFPANASFTQQLAMIRDYAQETSPEVLYMPSVGMSLLTICISNLRLAPLQIAGLGHPATTHSECIDYVSVEDDYVGDPACFSEALLRLPKDGQPYRPSAAFEPFEPAERTASERVNIAIPSSLMKLSPSLLAAFRKIVERSEVTLQFHFLTNGGNLLTLMHLRKVLEQALPGTTIQVVPLRPYMDYIRYLDSMDMFLSPFPFGNTNGIVDAFTVGLPGVCKTGREVFERIDGAMFMRAYMPGWMVADTADEYVEAAVRLANNRDERESIRKYMLDKNVVQRFFEGRPEVFGEMVLELVEQQRLKTA